MPTVRARFAAYLRSRVQVGIKLEPVVVAVPTPEWALDEDEYLLARATLLDYDRKFIKEIAVQTDSIGMTTDDDLAWFSDRGTFESASRWTFFDFPDLRMEQIGVFHVRVDIAIAAHGSADEIHVDHITSAVIEVQLEKVEHRPSSACCPFRSWFAFLWSPASLLANWVLPVPAELRKQVLLAVNKKGGRNYEC